MSFHWLRCILLTLAAGLAVTTMAQAQVAEVGQEIGFPVAVEHDGRGGNGGALCGPAGKCAGREVRYGMDQRGGLGGTPPIRLCAN